MGISGQLLKPFVLASESREDVSTVVEKVKIALSKGDFEIVGEYAPYAGAHVVVATNDYLRRVAESEANAIFLAGQRISITESGDGTVQVAYTNPRYFSAAYRVKADIEPVNSALESTLGRVETFGARGLSSGKLSRYHYSFGMEYFDDFLVLAEYDSFQRAVDVVVNSLKEGIGDSNYVYGIDLPGSQLAVFGVGIGSGMGSDSTVMDVVDFQAMKQTAHLPYEVVVQGGRVMALAPRFRIAVDFPDLRMTGDHGFSKLMAAPDAIHKTLTLVAGKQWENPVWKSSLIGGGG